MSFEIQTTYHNNIHSIAREVLVHTKDRKTAGFGSFATIYSIDEDTVLKVTSGTDKGYLQYLDTISKLGGDNPHLPKIHSAVYHRLSDEARREAIFYEQFEKIVVYMEKLAEPEAYGREFPFSEKKYQHPPVAKFNSKLLEYVLSEEDKSHTLRDVHRVLVNVLRVASRQNEIKNAGWLDLHSGNSMLRGRRFVVTDPLAC